MQAGKFWDDDEKMRIATRILQRAVKMPERTIELWGNLGTSLLAAETTKKLAWLRTIELVRMMGFETVQATLTFH